MDDRERLGKLWGLANEQLVEVESTRDLSQTIVHVDMDAFVSEEI